MSEKVKVADLIAETLEKLDIRHVFGITGAGDIHLYDAIARRGFSKVVFVHHEQAATMAMQTYYRVSKRLAACVITTGGGSTNGVTGVVSAWADSIPGIVIAGNENSTHVNLTDSLRMWGTQGYDSVDMVKKVTKYSTRVMYPSLAVYEIEKAFHVSLEGRPGPVWVEIPMDIQGTLIDKKSVVHYELEDKQNGLNKTVLNQVQKVIETLKQSKRPVFWLGHGIRLAGAEKQITKLLNQIQIPTLVSWAGIDMVDSDHPLVYGRAGVYGQRSANFVLQNSDYILAIGTRMAIPQIGYNLKELAREAVIDVVDIDPLEATKLENRIRESIVCDAKEFISALLNELSDQITKNEWVTQCDQYRKEFPWVDTKWEHSDTNGFINSYRFLEVLNSYFKDDQIVVTDMGTALLSGHQVLKIKENQRLMTSTGLGEMGYGLPAAIGASFASDKKEVMCLNCDGGMMMNLQELQTIVHHKLPIKIFIFNNDGYLMIKHSQNNMFKGRHVGSDTESGVTCPDFSKVGAAFDIPTYQIRTWEDCEKILPEVQSAETTVICEVFMDPTQLFSPKLNSVLRDDGTWVPAPLEDLSPLIPRSILEKAMIIGMSEKSKTFK
jgi:acetolactate synthase-1/2/3 large subunit